MFKRTITFKDFNDQERTKDFYFHLSKAELLEWSSNGDFQSRLQKMIDAKDMSMMLKQLKDIIGMSVGIRSEDGETFIKTEAAKQTLLSSPAYDELLFELVSDMDSAVAFVKQLVPPSMQQELEKHLKAAPASEVEDDRPAWIRENREPSELELRGMTREQLQEVYARRFASVQGKTEG